MTERCPDCERFDCPKPAARADMDRTLAKDRNTYTDAASRRDKQARARNSEACDDCARAIKARTLSVPGASDAELERKTRVLAALDRYGKKNPR